MKTTQLAVIILTMIIIAASAHAATVATTIDGVFTWFSGPADGLAEDGYWCLRLDRRGHVIASEAKADGLPNGLHVAIWDSETWVNDDFCVGYGIETERCGIRISPEGDMWAFENDGNVRFSSHVQGWPPQFECIDSLPEEDRGVSGGLFATDGSIWFKPDISLLHRYYRGDVSVVRTDLPRAVGLSTWDMTDSLWMTAWEKTLAPNLYRLHGQDLIVYEWSTKYWWGMNVGIDTAGSAWVLFSDVFGTPGQCGIGEVHQDDSYYVFEGPSGGYSFDATWFLELQVDADNVVWVLGRWQIDQTLDLYRVSNGYVHLVYVGRALRPLVKRPQSLVIDHKGHKWICTEGEREGLLPWIGGILRIEDGGAPQQKLELRLDDSGDFVAVFARIMNAGCEVSGVDAYLAVELEDEMYHYPNWGTSPVPHRLIMAPGFNQEFEVLHVPKSGLSPGQYTLYAAISLPGRPEHLIGRPGDEIQVAIVNLE